MRPITSDRLPEIEVSYMPAGPEAEYRECLLAEWIVSLYRKENSDEQDDGRVCPVYGNHAVGGISG
ncbi:MAG: hypothetical protein ACLS9H_03875 [Dialister sp.]